jgi:hypothetical protein
MIFNLLVPCLVIALSIYGIIYWAGDGQNLVNNLPGTSGTCQMFERGSSCTFGQIVIYFAPYFICIILIALGTAVAYASLRPIVL